MKWGVLVFPGSNDDRDTVYALGEVLGYDVVPIWHGDADLGDVDAAAVDVHAIQQHLACDARAFRLFQQAVQGAQQRGLAAA